MKYYVADFETTVEENTKEQSETHVWASAIVEVGGKDVLIHNSISEFMQHIFRMKSSVTIYFHNLKFDGTFILDYLYFHTDYKQAYTGEIKDNTVEFIKTKQMLPHTYKYSINSMGKFYSITVKTGSATIYFRDSLKLLPFSVGAIGDAFCTSARKLKMDYKRSGHVGGAITEQEKDYIKNDVLVMSEAMDFMLSNGHREATIGSCCLKEFKKSLEFHEYRELFPNLKGIIINGIHVEKFIRKTFRGGWCYLKPEKAQKEFKNGLTLDVNSLYPSSMHSESGNYYPVGYPHYFEKEELDNIRNRKDRYYFVHCSCNFTLRKGYLPYLQLKGNLRFKGNEYLITTKVFNPDTGRYESYYSLDGEVKSTVEDLFLTKEDFEKLFTHYQVEDFTFHCGFWFFAEIGLFDRYINKYKEIKTNNKGALRTLAKLFLNNLYGKFATSDDSSFKVMSEKGGVICFYDQIQNEKEVQYIPVGSAVTAKARDFTIKEAQQNYDNFIYADTDSLHLSTRTIRNGIPIDSNRFCHWSIESEWEKGWFVRQKTYVECCGDEIDIKCAGMPKQSKAQFIEKYKSGEFTLEDFTYGLTLTGKLLPKKVRGGTILVETTYEMK